MVNYQDIYATLSRIVSAANDPSVSVPSINITGLSVPESMQHIAGLYLASLIRYHQAVSRGGEQSTVGYEELRQAAEILIAARKCICSWGGSSQFSTFAFSPEESDEVLISLSLQEFDQFTRTNIYMLIGRAAISTEQSDSDIYEFSSWIDLQLHSLSMFCVAHDIDLAYIIYQIYQQNKPSNNEP